MAAVCEGFIVVETIVLDAKKPLMALADESKTANQALLGVGCRPSPSFVAWALNRVGFPHVYVPISVPQHEDFIFKRLDDMESTRDGHNLRAIFVGSRKALNNPNLVSVVA
jgi:hypothetical protein